MLKPHTHFQTMGKALTKVTKSELKCKRDSAQKCLGLMDAFIQFDSPLWLLSGDNHQNTSKKVGKDHEMIQSSTTHDPGYHMGK